MKMQTLRRWLWALLSIGLAGCATAPPAVFYTLTPLPEVDKADGVTAGQSLAIGIGPVSFPTFLDRAQLVARGGVGRLTVDEQHRWAGSLEDDFSRVLGENLAHLLATSRILPHTAEVRYPLDFRLVADVLRWQDRAWIVYEDARGTHRYPMNPVDPGRHSFRFYGVEEAIRYRITTPSLAGGWHRILTYRPPAVLAARVQVMPPAYTGLAPREFAAVSGGCRRRSIAQSAEFLGK